MNRELQKLLNPDVVELKKKNLGKAFGKVVENLPPEKFGTFEKRLIPIFEEFWPDLDKK